MTANGCEICSWWLGRKLGRLPCSYRQIHNFTPITEITTELAWLLPNTVVKRLDISARYRVTELLRYFFDLLLSQPNLVYSCRELFEVIDRRDNLVDEWLQFGSMIDSPARGFQERRAIQSLNYRFSHRVHVTGRIRCEIVTKLRILSIPLRDLFGICEESNNLEQRILCSLDLRRRCFRAPELVVAIHINSLPSACETKSRAIQGEEICLEVSPEAVAE
jgi:hypothetical protein